MTTRTRSKAVTLADLSEDDRRALLEEAREAARHNPRDVPGLEALSERELAVRDLMDARDHTRGCPVAAGEELGRIEGYDARRPPDPASGSPEKWLGVIRCVTCGGATVLDERLEAALDAHAATVAAAADGGDPDPDDTL